MRESTKKIMLDLDLDTESIKWISKKQVTELYAILSSVGACIMQEEDCEEGCELLVRLFYSKPV